MDILNTLPEKGIKRAEAISLLNDGELLLHLAQTEKGDCKKVAIKTLANLEYPESSPFFNKLYKNKKNGEIYLMPAKSAMISDLVADEITPYFEKLLKNPCILSDKEHQLFYYNTSILLGKSTEKICELYRLFASSQNEIKSLFDKSFEYFSAEYKNFCKSSNQRYRKNDVLFELKSGLGFSKENMDMIFPYLLTTSILYNPDKSLIALAEELFLKHSGAWLMPKVMADFLTKSSQEIYDLNAKYLIDDTLNIYVQNVLGFIIVKKWNKYNAKPCDFIGNTRYIASMKWGDLKYGEYDSSLNIRKEIEHLAPQFLKDLTEAPEEEKAYLPYQTINRSGAKFGDYDEMIAKLIPTAPNEVGDNLLAIKDDNLVKQIKIYFEKRKSYVTEKNDLYEAVQELF